MALILDPNKRLLHKLFIKNTELSHGGKQLEELTPEVHCIFIIQLPNSSLELEVLHLMCVICNKVGEKVKEFYMHSGSPLLWHRL